VSVLVATVMTMLALAVGGFERHLTEAIGRRARTQTAADAAALAAVGESAPYGLGSPELLARRYAAANGARLLECRCEPGSTSMQVRVAIGDVQAEARAVLDPTAIAPVATGFEAGGLHPELAAAVEQLVRASGGHVYLVSGYRSSARQQELWVQALAKYGTAENADDWVAPPGRSMHERGLAVDLGGDLDLALRLIEAHGLPLYRPLSNEPWHFELLGTRPLRG
jgi:hypothetical protein